MGRQSVMLYAAGDRRYDDCGTMAITYVVLNNQHRSDACSEPRTGSRSA